MIAPFGLALVSFALGAVFGPFWLRFLRDYHLGKQLNPSEPSEHAPKEGTPTMGGPIFLAPIIAVTLAFEVFFTGRLIMLVPVALVAGCAALGAGDDLQTLVGRPRSAGLSPAVKWGVTLALCLAAVGALSWDGMNQVHVPFVGSYVVPLWMYVPFATLVLLASIFGVGITDGLDSLAASTAALAFVAFWVVGTVLGYPLSAGLSGIAVGALLAFLWFNAFPAQVIMGDMGSLALGALLGIVALIEREPLILIPAGFVFVVNVLADILQVATNKLTSKRMFRYAPLHHHLRRRAQPAEPRWVNWPQQAWSETQVVQRLWIAGALGAFVAIMAALAG